MESNLKKLHKDMAEGKPLPLKKKGGVASGAEEVELRLGAGDQEADTSEEDEEDQSESTDEGR